MSTDGAQPTHLGEAGRRARIQVDELLAPLEQPLTRPCGDGAISGRVDANHLRAEVGEDHRGQRSGHPLGEIQDPQPCGCTGHRSASPFRPDYAAELMVVGSSYGSL